jgi:anti-sigma regulatory factor (Ser/Thr protein kinase)
MTAHAPTQLELQFQPTAHTPWFARRSLTEKFAGQLDNSELQDARLLTSELVTNAVLHGRGSIELHAHLDEERLTVDIADQGGGFERPPREHDLETAGGHGLHIVDTLASRWGIHPGSSHVWFELDRGRRRPGPSATPLTPLS